ncbi:E3 ubiquitin-protein ligase mib2 [Desmophyllum pertusum]|uniref:E3 ubiquitin-protein ligase mib2 n=1 Tax=Desmophyllum pertusum TaxID=174260 RepID=A0A9W9ZQA2_9CNID|nr:E3 ubiquitin-protein ligase mib2 [Desmophyllum pertusum]
MSPVELKMTTLKLLRLLVKHGADIDIRDGDGFTPLQIAAIHVQHLFVRPMPSSANKLSFVEKDPSLPHGRARGQTNDYESQNESNDSTVCTYFSDFSVGLRVVRGADWNSDDNESDGGEGFVGTVVEMGRNSASVPEYMAVIQWDMGTREV